MIKKTSFRFSRSVKLTNSVAKTRQQEVQLPCPGSSLGRRPHCLSCHLLTGLSASNAHKCSTMTHFNRHLSYTTHRKLTENGTKPRNILFIEFELFKRWALGGWENWKSSQGIYRNQEDGKNQWHGTEQDMTKQNKTFSEFTGFPATPKSLTRYAYKTSYSERRSVCVRHKINS